MRSFTAGLVLATALTSSLAYAAPETNQLGQASAADPGGPLWPPDCTRDMPRDGLVLLDPAALRASDVAATGALEVTLQRTSDGSYVPGALEGDASEGPLARWQSAAPLLAYTEYKIEARQRDAQGQVQGEKLIGFFTTGDSFLAPLAFSGRPAVRLLAQPSEPGTSEQEAVRVRIALPGLSGGLPQRILQISAALAASSEEVAASARVSDAQVALPGQNLGFELEALLQDVPSERCVTLTARDDLGHQLVLEPALCVSLPARASAEPSQPASEEESDHAPSFETHTSERAATGASEATPSGDPAAGGCAVGGAGAPDGLLWLLTTVPVVAIYRRRRH